jgi:hypothetical protein
VIKRTYTRMRCLLRLHRWEAETGRAGIPYESCEDCGKSRPRDLDWGQRPDHTRWGDDAGLHPQ